MRYIGIMGYILGLDRDNGKENGNYYCQTVNCSGLGVSKFFCSGGGDVCASAG